MIKFLLILVFSTNLTAANLIAFYHPLYFFDVGDEIYMCIHKSKHVACLGRHKQTAIKVEYKCTAVLETEGYLKNCQVTGAI